MSQIPVAKHKKASASSPHSTQQQTVWLLCVDGETFIVLTKTSNDQPIKTLGRLRGPQHFSSQKQANLIREWAKTLGPDQPPMAVQADLPLVEISELDLIAISKAGLTSRQMLVLAERLDLSAKEMARLLTLSPRWVHRRKPEDRLDQVASERLLMLTILADHGFAVFEDQGRFNRWLRLPLGILGHQAPLDILDTSQGLKLVDTMLGRIEHSVYS